MEGLIFSNLKRILVRCPSWIGDAVMATPFLEKLRFEFPAAWITYMVSPYVKDVYAGSPYVDEFLLSDSRLCKTKFVKRAQYSFENVKRLKKGKFDAAILLSNSFESALETFLAGIPLRIGYKRDGRSLMISRGLHPAKSHGTFMPGPMIQYYNRLGECLGFEVSSERMKLFISEEEKDRVNHLFKQFSISPKHTLIGINPGGAFGSSKFWLPEYFAQVGDYFAQDRNCKVILLAGPGEEKIIEKITRLMRYPALIWTCDMVPVGVLKGVVKELSLLITNDTGPRHFASAFGIPSIVLIGPTDPRWTEHTDPKQIVLGRVPVCGPCHLKVCPLNHQCMKGIKPVDVIDASEQLLEVVSHE